MKITIVGSGSRGALLAANLTREKFDVWMLDSDARRVKKFLAEGVTLETSSGSSKTKINATTDPKEIKETDAIFLCVKSYDTEGALKSIKGLLGEKTYVVSLQDGLGNLQMISEYVDEKNIIGAVTTQSAILTENGHLKHMTKGTTIIGQENGKVLGGIREISSILNKAISSTKVTKDINSAIWSRLIIDVGINALSAITRLKNGSLLKNEYTREVMRRAVSEAVKVAKRKKVKLTYDDPIQKVEAVCKATAEDISPMLHDILNKTQTEIDFINGAITRQAKSLNIKTPTNEMLTELIKAIELNYKDLET